MIDQEKARESSSGQTTLFQWILIAVAFLWFLWPALFSVHVEAFSARLQSEAILGSKGHLGLADQAYPVVTQYLYSSRQFTVVALEALMRLTHSLGDFNFRVLILGSWTLFFCAILTCIRRWTARAGWQTFAAVLLVPGLVQVSFFFADNLPSAALAVTAIALIAPKMPGWRWLVIGACFATSVLFRVDAVFALPSILAVALIDEEVSYKALVKGAVLFTVAALVVFVLGWRITGVSLLQAFKIVSYFAKMHANYSVWHRNFADTLKLFFGLPAMFLILLGGWRNWRTQSPRRNLFLTIYPALLYLYYATKAIEVRDFLLLGAPFVVLHVKSGIEELASVIRGNATQRLLAYAGGGIALLALLLPPHIRMNDGPHLELGYFWSPVVWRQWQKAVESNLDQCDALARSSKPNEHLLAITSMYNAEAYLYLRLLQNGYLTAPSPSGTPYGQAATLVEKDGATFLLLRTENPYGIMSQAPFFQPALYTQSFELSQALAAVSTVHFDRAYLVSWSGPQNQEFLASSLQFNRDAGPMDFWFKHYAIVKRRTIGDGRIRVIALSPEDVAEIKTLVDREVVETTAQAGGKWTPMQDFMQMRSHLMLDHWKP